MINLELGLGDIVNGRRREEEELEYKEEAALLQNLFMQLPPDAGAPSTTSYNSLHSCALHFHDLMSSHNINTTSSNILLDQQLGSPLPPDWEQCLDLKSGDVFYKNLSTGNTTHMDPRALALEENVDDSRHFRASRSGTLIRTNIKAAGADQVYDHDPIDFALSDTIQQEKAYLQEKLSLDVDLDLRLSSFLHVKHTLPSQSSSTSSHDSSVLMKSYSSLSCVSDTTMRGPLNNNAISDVMRVDDYGSAPQIMPARQCSGSFSSSSSPSSAMSYQRQAYDDSEEDDIMNVDVDINRFAANEGASMQLIAATCARCLMFVLLSSTKEPMRCPVCGSHANPL